MIDPMIHANEFKLRLLLTDRCNRRCSFCLNDFQRKPGSEHLSLPIPAAKEYVDLYCSEMRNTVPAQVYISGGEPTLVPGWTEIVREAAQHQARITLNTNGSYSDSNDAFVRDNIQCPHFGVYEINQPLADKIKRVGGTVQCVFSLSHKYVSKEFLRFYMQQGIKVKVFSDFREENTQEYRDFAADMWYEYGPTDLLSFRHTGIQVNRGGGCAACMDKCITLKALWVFPDMSVSPCPRKPWLFRTPRSTSEMREAIRAAYEFHKRP